MTHSWKAVFATAVLSAIAFGAGGARESAASLVTYNFAGVIDIAPGGLSSLSGATFIGSYTFESTTAALPAAPGADNSISAVFNALTSLNFSIGGFSASTTGAPEIQIGNKGAGGTSLETTDRYAVVTRATDGLTGSGAIGGETLSSFSLRLDQAAGTLFGAADGPLPTTVSLGDFDTSLAFFFFSTDLAVGHLTAFGPDAVPEPATLAILGLGLLGLGAATRRRKPIT